MPRLPALPPDQEEMQPKVRFGIVWGMLGLREIKGHGWQKPFKDQHTLDSLEL